MIKIVPILLGIIGSYLVAVIVGNGFGVESFAIDFSDVASAHWFGNPIDWSRTVFCGVTDKSFAISAIIAVFPIAFATMMEHIGDISAISATANRNYINDPGLHRTLLGDGLATILASLFGAPANTTYGENTGVLALSKVYDPRVIRIAAYFAIFFSFSPKFAAVIESIPGAIVGGISFVLYGMISAVGVRNVVEAKVDFSKARNTIIAAIILVVALGLTDGVKFTIGSADINLSALAVASIVGIILNLIFPDKDFDSEVAFKADSETAQINLESDYGEER
jgi:uracil permease